MVKYALIDDSKQNKLIWSSTWWYVYVLGPWYQLRGNSQSKASRQSELLEGQDLLDMCLPHHDLTSLIQLLVLLWHPGNATALVYMHQKYNKTCYT